MKTIGKITLITTLIILIAFLISSGIPANKNKAVNLAVNSMEKRYDKKFEIVEYGKFKKSWYRDFPFYHGTFLKAKLKEKDGDYTPFTLTISKNILGKTRITHCGYIELISEQKVNELLTNDFKELTGLDLFVNTDSLYYDAYLGNTDRYKTTDNAEDILAKYQGLNRFGDSEPLTEIAVNVFINWNSMTNPDNAPHHIYNMIANNRLIKISNSIEFNVYMFYENKYRSIQKIQYEIEFDRDTVYKLQKDEALAGLFSYFIKNKQLELQQELIEDIKIQLIETHH